MSAGSGMDASPSRQITVVDVYDLASAIGKDFERLIEQYGVECVRSLMAKVISALETLESLASSNDRDNEQVVSLTRAVERLEVEKQEKIGRRMKFEEELEQVEENYRTEIAQLWAIVRKQQVEVKELRAAHQVENPAKPSSEDLNMLVTLKQTSETQKEQIKNLQTEGIQRNEEIEELRCQVDNLKRQNKELQRKYTAIQKQGRLLVEEKSELIRQLQEEERKCIQLNHALDVTQRAKRDLEQDTKAGEPFFTLDELKEVLQAKNDLKARVMELEEELEQFRPSPSASCSSAQDEKKETASDELLVYGPINKEPEEKLHPWKYTRKDSRIKSFFDWSKSAWTRSALMTTGAPAPPTLVEHQSSSSLHSQLDTDHSASVSTVGELLDDALEKLIMVDEETGSDEPAAQICGRLRL